MRNLKRVFSLALALVMVLGMMVIGTSAATFTDAEEITYQEAVDVMSALGVIDGIEAADGTYSFDPTATLTREQGAKILCYMLMGKTAAEKLTGSGKFTDVAADRWSAGAIDYCASLNILAGVGDNKFDPTGELTAVQFGKMLLCALGYDADIEGYTGANWATYIATDMIEIGLDIDGVAMDAQLTREQAAQMALQALTCNMVKYASKGTSVSVNGVDIVTGASAAEAVKITSETTNYDQTGTPKGVGYQQFCEKYFPLLKKTAGLGDSFGRPSAYLWYIDDNKNGTLDGFVLDSYVYDAMIAPAKTYVSGFNSAEKTKLEKAYYTLADNIVINGAPAGTNCDTISELANRNYRGTIVELYDTDNTPLTIELAVVVDGYFAKVTKITEDVGAVAGIFEYVVYNPYSGTPVVKTVTNTSSAYDNYDYLTAAYGVGDHFMAYYLAADTSYALIDFADVTSVTGTVNAEQVATGNRGTVTVDGVAYPLSDVYAATMDGSSCGTGRVKGDKCGYTLGKTATLYLDANGYVIAAVGETAMPTYCAVLNHATYSVSGLEGGSEEQAVILLPDGTTKQVVLDTTGVYSFTKNSGKTSVTDATLTWYSYTINGKGEYKLSAIVSPLAATNVTAGTDDVVKGVPTFGSDVANNDTIVIVRSGAGTKASPYTYKTYTGYQNMPSLDNIKYTGIKASATNMLSVVMVYDSTSVAAVDGTVKAIVLDATPVVTYVNANTTTYTYSVAVDGDNTKTITFKNTDPSLSAKTMYAVNIDEDGYAALDNAVYTNITTSGVAGDAFSSAAASKGILTFTATAVNKGASSQTAYTYTGDETVYVVALNGSVTTTSVEALVASEVGYNYKVIVSVESLLTPAGTIAIDTIWAIQQAGV